MRETLGTYYDQVFFTHLLGCRPPDNRDPLYHEIDACRPRLAALLKVLRPQAVLIFGGKAMRAMTGKVNLARRRGEKLTIKMTWKGEEFRVLAFVTHACVDLARIQDSSHRAEVLADIENAAIQAGFPLGASTG